MGKLERRVLGQGWCSMSEYKQLKKLGWYDKLFLWAKRWFRA